MIARRNLEKLAGTLMKQGKNKDDVYALLGKQFKQQFNGKVSMSGSNPDQPWSISQDGKLTVFALTNNKDQVLTHTTQALVLTNDPIYQSKRSEWAKTNKELTGLKNNVMFDSDSVRVKNLETKVNNLTKEINQRQSELLS